jgi:hypothetical protein
VLARALWSASDVAVFVNADILLFNDLVDTAARLQARFPSWVGTASRRDLDSLPFSISTAPEGDLRLAGEGGAAQPLSALSAFVEQNSSLHTYGGTDVWLWNVLRGADGQPTPLHGGPMPAFIYGRGVYDNWLNHEIVATGLRTLVDISLVVQAVHVAHTHELTGLPPSRRSLADSSFWSRHKKSSWEQFSNTVNAHSHGSYVLQKGTALHAEWKMALCDEPLLGNACLLRRARPGVCTCEHSYAVLRSDTDPVVSRLDNKTVTCGSLSSTNLAEYTVTGRPSAAGRAVPGLPHTLEQLLPRVADAEKTVVLTGLLGNYLDMLMSFVCSLRKLGVANVLVAAFDEAAYRGAFLQGLPVFLADSAAVNSTACEYGTDCFKTVTKAKSRATLRVLQAGYTVLFSDSDVLWFTNPLPALKARGLNNTLLLVQSNEPVASQPANGLSRINSGFYFAAASPATLAAFAAIVAHAAASSVSEQPSFYDVLCGVGGKYRLGEDACQMPDAGVRTEFLDRDAYPNGKHRDVWDAPDVLAAARRMGAVVLHNNWVVGGQAKVARQRVWWHYDEARAMCQYSWAGGKAAGAWGGLGGPV